MKLYSQKIKGLCERMIPLVAVVIVLAIIALIGYARYKFWLQIHPDGNFWYWLFVS